MAPPPDSAEGPAKRDGSFASTIIGVAPTTPSAPSTPVELHPDTPETIPPIRRRPPSSGSTAPTIAPLGDVALPSAVERTRIVPGRQLPGTPYKVVRLLGEGGMGSVYEAEHVDIGRHVALKILHPEQCTNPAVVQMFREEARAATRIGSKYIVEVLDFDELADGRFMFVMELLDSVTLDDAGRDGPIDPERMIGVLRQACKGIGAAHSANIIHRDIKPENIMLCRRDGRDDFVKIVDFGISTIREDVRGDGKVVGTPEFVSPEQASGGIIDGRSDMYSLACTAYAAFAGRPPFKGTTLIDVLTMHLMSEPKALAAWRSYHGCPPQLEAVIRRAMEKNPADRYADMADFEAAICEAQIAAGVQTPWDDLPIPDVALERRERLLRDMPGKVVVPAPKRGRVLAVIAFAGVISAFGAWYFSNAEAPATEVRQDDPVMEIVTEARAAGARAYYVYPPPEDAKQLTAYQRVVELEALQGEDEARAKEQAAELRAEFAAALERLGDWLYEEPGGKAFAADYYIQALIFVPQGQRRDRVKISAGELAELRRKAKDGDFTRAELVAVQPLVELQAAAAPSTDDTQTSKSNATKQTERAKKKRRALRRALKGKRNALEAKKAELDQAIVDVGGPLEGDEDTKDREAVDAEDIGPAQDTAPSIDPPPDPAEAAAMADQPTSTPAKRPPSATKALLRQARGARKSGNAGKAKKLYAQVVDGDGNNAEALIALSDISFDEGNYTNAVRFGKRAVAAAPRNAGYRIKLGDAYYKRLKFTEARAEYNNAAKLGHPAAARKLAKVNDKLGR